MRVNAVLPISFLLLLAIPTLASSDEIQKLTVAELADKCTTTDVSSAAFCSGLATGVLNQLLVSGAFFGAMAIRREPLSEDMHLVLKYTATACGEIEPKMALMAFINWARLHPEFQRQNGIMGVATAIGQAWPCKE
jgi:hypothetical protein